MNQTFSKAVLAATVCAMSACSTMQAVPLGGQDAPLSGPINPGDSLVLTLRDGAKVPLKVSVVTPDAVEGSGAGKAELRYTRAQIGAVQRSERDGTKTAMLVGAITVGAGLFLGAALAAMGGL